MRGRRNRSGLAMRSSGGLAVEAGRIASKYLGSDTS